MAASSSSAVHYPYDVFISHRGPDTKKTLASHLYRGLSNNGLRTFLDQPELEQGELFPSQIENAVRTASIHVAVLSPRYAESSWCLNELLLMLESGKPILPVFYHVASYEIRWNSFQAGRYEEALQRMEKKITYEGECRYDSNTIVKWRDALSRVAEISGFELDACNGDEGELVDKVVRSVVKKMKKPGEAEEHTEAVHYPYDVFINRGRDTEKTLASHLYHGLSNNGLRTFRDHPDLRELGDSLTSQREDVVRTTSIHVAVFSPLYAESSWCLNELLLMLESGKTIIPVFYHVAPAELRWTRGKAGRYGKALQELAKKKKNWQSWKVRESPARAQYAEKYVEDRQRMAQLGKAGKYAEDLQRLAQWQRMAQWEYDSDMAECRYDSNTIEKWRDALSRVANISGFELDACNNGDEGELVDKVVRSVLKKMKKPGEAEEHTGAGAVDSYPL